MRGAADGDGTGRLAEEADTLGHCEVIAHEHTINYGLVGHVAYWNCPYEWVRHSICRLHFMNSFGAFGSGQGGEQHREGGAAITQFGRQTFTNNIGLKKDRHGIITECNRWRGVRYGSKL